MALIFQMPQLGSTMEEGTILTWFKQEGDSVQQGEALLEIETDKATMTVESPAAGVVRKILAPADRMVAIRKPIAILGAADETIDHLLAEVGLASPAAPMPVNDGAGEETTMSLPGLLKGSKPAAPPLPAPTGRLNISPRARRMADQAGVPVAALAGQGTGPDKRILERDVIAYLAAKETHPALEVAANPTPRATPLAARMADDLGINLSDLASGLPGSRVRSADVLRHAESAPSPASEARPLPAGQTADTEEVSLQSFSGMRKRIADNVAKSAFTAPHVTLTLEVDMTACSEFRASVIPAIEKAYGARLSYTDILVKAVAHVLGEFPRLNASLAGDQLKIFSHKNIGVAVALEEGLVVPVVKEAEKKSLGAICAELKPLIERARTGKFSPDDLAGGTFSITNLGAFGIDVFDPIIVTGQAAILGVGRIADKPVVVNKQIVVRSMMNLCLSFDHRIVDGAPAARFLQRLKELLENPLLMLV